MIKIKVPATIGNFGPGFDCLGAAIDLYNEFTIYYPSPGGKLQIQIEGEGKESLPENETNIVYQAMEKTSQCIGKKLPDGIKIKLKNRIPLKRGLGSSATARIAGVISAGLILNEKLSHREIINLATELEGHPDNVIPAVVGGLCICYKANNELNYFKIALPKDISVLLCIPDIEIETIKAREILPKEVPRDDAIFNCSRVALLISALKEKKYDLLKCAFNDKLHQPYRSKLIPAFYDVIDVALKNGALGAALSGSGSTIFMIIKKGQQIEKIKSSVKNLFLRNNIKCKFKVLGFNNKGIEVLYK